MGGIELGDARMGNKARTIIEPDVAAVEAAARCNELGVDVFAYGFGDEETRHARNVRRQRTWRMSSKRPRSPAIAEAERAPPRARRTDMAPWLRSSLAPPVTTKAEDDGSARAISRLSSRSRVKLLIHRREGTYSTSLAV